MSLGSLWDKYVADPIEKAVDSESWKMDWKDFRSFRDCWKHQHDDIWCRSCTYRQSGAGHSKSKQTNGRHGGAVLTPVCGDESKAGVGGESEKDFR